MTTLDADSSLHSPDGSPDPDDTPAATGCAPLADHDLEQVIGGVDIEWSDPNQQGSPADVSDSQPDANGVEQGGWGIG